MKKKHNGFGLKLPCNLWLEQNVVCVLCFIAISTQATAAAAAAADYYYFLFSSK